MFHQVKFIGVYREGVTSSSQEKDSGMYTMYIYQPQWLILHNFQVHYVQKFILNSQRIKLGFPMLGVVVPQVLANVVGGNYIQTISIAVILNVLLE